MAQFPRTVINNLTHKIIAAAIEVHRQLGPGLLESVYQRCMEQEPILKDGVRRVLNKQHELIDEFSPWRTAR